MKGEGEMKGRRRIDEEGERGTDNGNKQTAGVMGEGAKGKG